MGVGYQAGFPFSTGVHPQIKLRKVDTAIENYLQLPHTLAHNVFNMATIIGADPRCRRVKGFIGDGETARSTGLPSIPWGYAAPVVRRPVVGYNPSVSWVEDANLNAMCGKVGICLQKLAT